MVCEVGCQGCRARVVSGASAGTPSPAGAPGADADAELRLTPRSRLARQAPWLGGAALLLAAAAAAVLWGGSAGTAGAQAGTVERTSVLLPVQRRTLGSWKPVVAHEGAYIGFARVGPRKRAMLRLSDRPGRGGDVALRTRLRPRTAVGGSVEVNLVRQRLRAGKARALVSVAGTTGVAVEAGVVRRAGAGLRWAIWHRTPTGRIDGLVVSRRAVRLGGWHEVKLATRWARDGARSFLRVDGTVVARAAPRDLGGVLASRVTVGLGRPSAAEETGVLLVRAAKVDAASGVGGGPGAGPGAGGPGVTPPGQAPVTPLPGRLLRKADFETGDTSQFDYTFATTPDRVRVVNSPVREGRFAGRFEVRQGEDPICQGGGGCFGDRAELTVDTDEREGDERWYSWSTMVDASVPNTQAFQVVSQWHARADGRPPVAFFAQGDQLVLWVHPHRAPGDQISFVKAWSGPLRKGQWQDIRVHAKWSGSDSVGFLELWVNDQRQTFDDGTQRRYIRTMYPGIMNFFNQGYYRDSGIQGTGVVYHDGFTMNAAG